MVKFNIALNNMENMKNNLGKIGSMPPMRCPECMNQRLLVGRELIRVPGTLEPIFSCLSVT